MIAVVWEVDVVERDDVVGMVVLLVLVGVVTGATTALGVLKE
jgi:hypothetical protein